MEIKTHPVIQIYKSVAADQLGLSRIQMAKYCLEGLKNPRAKLYDLFVGQKQLADTIFAESKQLRLEGKTQQATKMMSSYNKCLNKVLRPKSHPILQSAHEKLMTSFTDAYPDRETQKFSKFIMLKHRYPFFGKFKFLANII